MERPHQEKDAGYDASVAGTLTSSNLTGTHARPPGERRRRRRATCPPMRYAASPANPLADEDAATPAPLRPRTLPRPADRPPWPRATPLPAELPPVLASRASRSPAEEPESKLCVNADMGGGEPRWPAGHAGGPESVRLGAEPRGGRSASPSSSSSSAAATLGGAGDGAATGDGSKGPRGPWWCSADQACGTRGYMFGRAGRDSCWCAAAAAAMVPGPAPVPPMAVSAPAADAAGSAGGGGAAVAGRGGGRPAAAVLARAAASVSLADAASAEGSRGRRCGRADSRRGGKGSLGVVQPDFLLLVLAMLLLVVLDQLLLVMMQPERSTRLERGRCQRRRRGQ